MYARWFIVPLACSVAACPPPPAATSKGSATPNVAEASPSDSGAGMRSDAIDAGGTSSPCEEKALGFRLFAVKAGLAALPSKVHRVLEAPDSAELLRIAPNETE